MVVETNGFYQYPKCYKTIDTEFSECIVLEDLKRKNFFPLNRYIDKATNEHVCLAMRALGKFHAISFALKDQQPEKFKTYASNIEQIMHSNTERSRQLHKIVTRGAIQSVSGVADVKLLDRLNKFYEKSQLVSAFECLNKMEPKAVICHGE